jgi:hypothetical protein
MAISATQLTLFFSISSLFFSTPPDNFSQIPQGLFTELIGLALLFSLFHVGSDGPPCASLRHPVRRPPSRHNAMLGAVVVFKFDR